MGLTPWKDTGRYSKTYARHESLLEEINFVRREFEKEFTAGGRQKCSPKKKKQKQS